MNSTTTTQLFFFSILMLLIASTDAQVPTGTSARGLEVSPAQGPFNWVAVRNGGYKFVYYGATQGLRSVRI